MATNRMAAKKSSKRSLTLKKDPLKDLTPAARSPKGGQITPYAPGQIGATATCAAITPYKKDVF